MLGFASLITLGMLFGFVAVIVLMMMYFGGQIDAVMLISITVIINVLMWLIAPFFMELMYRWFYKSQKLSYEELKIRTPRVTAFIEKTCSKYKIRTPKLFLIKDDNPTAFVFGSAAYNARLVFSEGLFTYLDEEEMEAVIAHELGHIRRRDFIIMTIASTLVQILYELSQILLRSRQRSSNNKKGNALALVGIISYIFYFVGTYLLLYLSRTREYGADKFSAEERGNPDALARALIKIAYGIIAKPDTANEQRLIKSTRALGIFDPHAAKQVGSSYEIGKKDWGFVGKVLLYDLVSPWAKVLELASTHPLTGKRIDALSKMATSMGKTPSINMAAIKQTPVDKHQLYSGFWSGVFVYFLPHIFVLAGLVAGLFDERFLASIPAGIGIAIIIKLKYKYPSGEPRKVTTLDAMSDLYASPVRGRLIELEGKAIGKGIAGSYFSEDMMFQDANGLIYLNYESAIPFFGNLLFGLSKVKKLLGQPAKATGWFLRGVSHHLDLKTFQTQEKTINSHPMLWAVVFAGIMIIVSLMAYSELASAIS